MQVVKYLIESGKLGVRSVSLRFYVSDKVKVNELRRVIRRYLIDYLTRYETECINGENRRRHAKEVASTESQP